MADLKIAGKIIQVLPLASGIGKNSGKEWKKQDFVLETINDQFPKKVAFGLFNDRITQYPINLGDIVTIYFDVESRDFNNRWYTDLRVWRVDKGDTTQVAAQQDFGGQPQQPAPGFGAPAPQAPGMQPPFGTDGGDDLPF